MNFNNLDKTKIFDTFCQKFKDKINLDSIISVYSSDYKEGNIVQQLELASNDSPYICDVQNSEIMRSDCICSTCNFTQEEEFALIAHELGHLNVKLNNIKCNNTQEEEYKADEYAVNLGLGNELESALEKILVCYQSKSDEWVEMFGLQDTKRNLRERIARL